MRKSISSICIENIDRGYSIPNTPLPESPDIVAICNIPYAKTIFERHLVDSLDSEGHNSLEDSNWLSFARQKAESCPSLSAVDLVEIATCTGFKVEISWSRQHSQRGGLDAIFHHYQPAHEGERVLFRFPTDHQGRPSYSLTSQPLRERLNRKIEKQLHKKLQDQLPSYMVPKVIKVLARMPINDNGKIDRQALAESAQVQRLDGELSARVPPRNEMERAICAEFTRVLGLDVGITDNFFDLGGHSLNALRVASGISKRLGWRITVLDFFGAPTPIAIAGILLSRAKGVGSCDLPWYMNLYSRASSRATIVLVHGLSGQVSVYSALVSFLDETFNVLLISDPFFGRADSPKSISEWAIFYLNEALKQIPRNHAIIFGGYSLGGLIAFEMASLWQTLHNEQAVSVLLMDPATYTPEIPVSPSKEWIENYCVQLFGADDITLIQEGFHKLEPVWKNSIEPPKYNGKCLYFVSSDTAKTPTPAWWIAKCSDIDVYYLDCSHVNMFDNVMIRSISRLINDHCRNCFE